MAGTTDAGSVIIPGDVTGPDAPDASPQQGDRPEWLPEGFNTPEEFVTKFNELNSANAPEDTGTNDGDEGEPQDTPQDTPENEAEDAAVESVLERAGLDLNDLSTEVDTTGDLSEEQYKALEEKAGIPRELAKGYVAGRMAQQAAYSDSIMSAVGGTEKYQQITEWAKGSLPVADIAAFNVAVSSGNVEQARLAVEGLAGRFAQANGIKPSLVTGGRPVTTGDSFDNWHQVTEAMADPRYKQDPAYRSKVAAKLDRSNL